jgi:hypothetical protein
MFRKQHFAAAVAALLTAGSATAATITGWSDVNVLTTPTLAGTSTIFDRALPNANALTNGRIGFDGTETLSPGLKVVNDAAAGSPPTSGDVFNCIMASSAASCNSERQSGKRFKLDRTELGAIDLVFKLDPTGVFATESNDGLYKVFQKFGNATGLFGPIDEEHPLDGYFDFNRAGYGLQRTSEDGFASTAMFGSYSTLFGNLLSYAQVPNGFFYDNDGNAATDNVLLAHQLGNGTWVQNRGLDLAGVVSTINYGNSGTAYADLAALVSALGTSSGLGACDPALPGTACLAGVGMIEDLAKFNLTYSVDPTQFDGSEFTLRFASAVPEPGTIVMMLTGLVLMGAAARRKKQA